VATASLARGAHESRAERALALFKEHGGDIERLSGEIFAVPSQDGLRMHRVDYFNEFCSCPDHQYRGATCIHLLMCGIWHAKSFVCDICEERHPKSERFEVHEEQVRWGMGVAEGDRLCRQCAREAGVL
jgi:hypothetical protein